MQCCEKDCAGVVHTGVDVEDDGNGHAAILPEASRPDSFPRVVVGFVGFVAATEAG